MRKGKHQLSFAERAIIENSLRNGKSVNAIAKELGRYPSTISREISGHLKKSTKGTAWSKNQCAKKHTCRISGLCNRIHGCRHKCAECSAANCNELCSQCEYIECQVRLKRSGRTCNGCKQEKTCHKVKFFYLHEHAHEEYRKTLVEARDGADMSEGEFRHLDDLVSPAILKGQSLHHICITNAGLITKDERTLRRYLDQGRFSAKRGDLKKACRMKKRKPKPDDCEYKAEKNCRKGRTIGDYQAFLSNHPGTQTVMMDLVIGRQGGKCLLTLHFPHAAFMVAFLIDNKCAENTALVFDYLWNALGPNLFKKLFPAILTDNGTEFSGPARLETAPGGGARTSVFYCDPMNSNQKSQLERNHELIREVLPKGTSFDGLTQKKVNLMMSHINAYVRLSQSDKTPYEVFEFMYGKGVAEKLGISKIDPRRVYLKPSLVGIIQPTLIEVLTKKK